MVRAALASAVFAALTVTSTAQDRPAPAMRCGWFANPSPANAWLTDKDGEWIIATQGGYQAEGDWPPGQYGKGQWIAHGPGSYGYGCACLKVTVDRAKMQVIEIMQAKARPLAACRADKALQQAERKLQ